MLKKMIPMALAVILTLSIAGCGDKNPDISEKPILEGIEFAGEAKEFDIHIVYFRSINMDYINDSVGKFNEIFDKELTITPHQVIDISGNKIVDLLNTTGAEGFYQFPLSNIERLIELRDSNSILAIDELLEGNQLWNEIPSALRNIFRLDDGHVWALPRSFEPVVYGRMIRADYLESLGLDVPMDLDSLYEVSAAFAKGDPDGNGITDTIGMSYYNAMNFRDIFSACGAPISIGSDGFQRTSIVYNTDFASYEDSMLLEEMEDALGYLVRLRQDGILRKEGWRFNSGGSMAGNPSTANLYDVVSYQSFDDSRIKVLNGIIGSRTVNLTPLSYDFSAGMYVIGANTPNASATLQTFVNLFLGDLEGFLFASRGAPGTLYELSGNNVIVNDYRFFSGRSDAILMNSPFFSYETMNLIDNTELADGTIVGRLLESIKSRTEYISESKQLGYMYDLSMDLAYPEMFRVREGELLNSSSAALFDTYFNRILSGSVSIKDGISAYIRGMKQTGMQEILDELNNRIGKKTNNSY
ncbi:MAG TPA: hypothetical protein P5315_05560 [Clostridia bacterium]|nr:hypothetical protein [Clostridia bacterium]